MLQRSFFIIFLSVVSLLSFSQGVAISPTGALPHTSAALDIQFTDKGLLIPRVSLVSTTQFSPPISGTQVTSLLVYNENDNLTGPGAEGKGFYFWNGSRWEKLGSSDAWRLTGNSNTDPLTHFLGTTDQSDLSIRTNSTERMRITHGGNVGINNSVPVALLHVTNTVNNRSPLIVESSQLLPQHYRLPIYIDATNRTDTLNNYQVLIIVNTQNPISQGKMQNDCDDIRFYTSSNQPLHYWIEDGCNTSQTFIWVRIPQIVGGQIDTIFMYYGFPNFSSGANGDSTFVFFDDFSGSTINTTKWQQWSSNYTISNGIITCWGTDPNLYAKNVANGGIVPTMPTYRIRHRAVTYASTNCRYGCTSWDQIIYIPAITSFWGPWNGSWNTYLLDVVNNALQQQNVTNWFKAEITYDGNKGKFFFNNAFVSEVTIAGKTLSYLYLTSCCRNSYDWVFIAKYVTPEPLISSGVEETVQSQWALRPVIYVKPSTGEVGVWTDQPTRAFQVGNQGDGTVAIANAWATFSSLKWKSNVQTLENVTSKLLQLHPISFTWNASGKQDVGLSAEETAKILPEIVEFDAQNNPIGIRYDRLNVYLLQALQEQQKTIIELQQEIANLKKKKTLIIFSRKR